MKTFSLAAILMAVAAATADEPRKFQYKSEGIAVPAATADEPTVQAVRAMATAPGWLENLKDKDLLAKVERMKKLLREHKPVNDYELAMKLQLASFAPELVPQDVRDAAIEMLWGKQLPDGGWST